MSNFTKEIDRRLRIAVFQFTIRRTHAADRMNTASHTFRNGFALPLTQLQKKMVPSLFHAARSNVVGFLVRQNADAHMSVWVNGKGLYSTPAGIQCAGFLQS